MALPRIARITACVLCLACAGCADRPLIGIELGSQRIQDCVPGSVSRPCN
jgi:hypothetical protein